MSVEMTDPILCYHSDQPARNLSPIPFANKLNLSQYPVGAPW